jgi:hypothetical protein
MGHALHAAHRAWITNEKGLVALAARLPSGPARFAERVGAAFDALGPDAARLDASLAIAAELLDDVEHAVRAADRGDRPE